MKLKRIRKGGPNSVSCSSGTVRLRGKSKVEVKDREAEIVLNAPVFQKEERLKVRDFWEVDDTKEDQTTEANDGS